jgi:hypothetical protein
MSSSPFEVFLSTVEGWSQAAVRDHRHLRDVAAAALKEDPSIDPSLGPSGLETLFAADVAAQPARSAAKRQMEVLQMAWQALP